MATKTQPKEFRYIQLDYLEAKENKKDLLTSQVGVLELVRNINNFDKIKAEKLNVKLNFQKELKSVKSKISSLLRQLPKVEETKSEKSEAPKKEKRSDNIIDELKQIKEKLKQLK